MAAVETLSEQENRVLQRVSRRFLWFLCLLLVFNFIDRTNIGFAALTMNRELGLSGTAFGLSLAAFSAGYMLCEIPSNLILARVGARRWIARILITWGLASSACMLVTGVKSLVVLRLLVGMAEAGFVPGIVLFLTYWYPQFYRARAHVFFMLGQPLASSLGALVSGRLLGLDGWLGITGWRWLFLIEGIPAVILGVITYFYLTDRPAQARWLSDEEKEVLATVLRRDAKRHDRAVTKKTAHSVVGAILSKPMLLVSLAFAMMAANFNMLAVWLPQVIQGMKGPNRPFWQIGVLTAVPSLCTLIAMPFWSLHSDRTKERYWHCLGPMALTAAMWALVALCRVPALQLLGMTVASMASFSAWPIFFTLPSVLLTRDAQPAGVAFMGTVGIAGATISPLLVGRIKDLTGSFAVPMGMIGVFMAIGVVAMLFMPRSLLTTPAAEPMS